MVVLIQTAIYAIENISVSFNEHFKPLDDIRNMTVVVNRSKIRIFNGARVGDAVLRWAVRNRLDISKVSSLEVTDKWGHKLDNAAPLSDNQIIKIINL